MANTASKPQEVLLTIPMYPDMELAAAKMASVLAELMNFDEGQVEEIQLAIIETCINAFEHSQSEDKKVVIEFIMKDDELEFKITDRGIGIASESRHDSGVLRHPDLYPDMRKRGWGLEIIRTLMDQVDIKTGANGTTVSVVKRKTT